MKGRVFDLRLSAGEFPLDIARLCELFLDPSQVILSQRDIKRGLYGLQICDLVLRLPGELRERFKGALLLVVFCKIPLGVLLGSLCRIKRDGDHFIRIIVERLQLFCPLCKTVSVDIDQLSVDLEFIPVFRISKLSYLEVIFLPVPLKGGLDDMPQIRGFLTDARDPAAGGIVSLQHFGDGLELFPRIAGKVCQRQGRKLLRLLAVIVDGGREAPFLYS